MPVTQFDKQDLVPPFYSGRVPAHSILQTPLVQLAARAGLANLIIITRI